MVILINCNHSFITFVFILQEKETDDYSGFLAMTTKIFQGLIYVCFYYYVLFILMCIVNTFSAEIAQLNQLYI